MDYNQIKDNMPDSDTLDDLTNLFKVLGDNTRAKILYSLKNLTKPFRSITELVLGFFYLLLLWSETAVPITSQTQLSAPQAPDQLSPLRGQP